MNNSNNIKNVSLKKATKTAVIIASFMLVVLFIYLVVVEIIRAQMSPFTGFLEIKNTLFVRYIFYGIAALQVILIRILRGFLLKKTFSSHKSNLTNSLFKISLLTLALAEVPAVLGLVLFLLAGLNQDFYILLFVSLFLMFMYFPRYNNWEKWIREKDPSKCSNCRL